jgi:Flp pilus assembly protein TadB
VAGRISKKVPWDQRLTERLTRESWEAANDPARRRRNPSFWAQIRSPYYWFAMLAFGVAVLIWFAASTGWPRAVAAVLYVVSLLASALARRDARAAGLRSGTMDGK